MTRLITFYGMAVLLLATACGETSVETEKTEQQANEPEQLIYREDGMYREFYPGRKQLKVEGPTDAEGKRHGKWAYYSENGLELSTTMYDHGSKEGFSLVKYPDGRVRYYGDYHNDKQVGIWKIYDSQGAVREIDYGQPAEK